MMPEIVYLVSQKLKWRYDLHFAWFTHICAAVIRVLFALSYMSRFVYSVCLNQLSCQAIVL